MALFTMANSYYTSNLTECVDAVTLFWHVPTSPLHSEQQFVTTLGSNWNTHKLASDKHPCVHTSHFKAGELLRTYFWKHCCLMDQQNCVPHWLIYHECHWRITPIDLIVMTLVCSCVTTVCAAKHNHDEVTVWMEQVCFKFSIFVLFKKLAIWLTSLHLPTVHLWFFTNQEAEPKNRCGWAQATRIWEKPCSQLDCILQKHGVQ